MFQMNGEKFKFAKGNEQESDNTHRGRQIQRERKRNKRICSFNEYSNIKVLTFNYTDTDTSQKIYLKIKKIVIFAEEK